MTLYDTQSGVALDDSHEKAVDAEIANLEAIRDRAQGRRVPISTTAMERSRDFMRAADQLPTLFALSQEWEYLVYLLEDPDSDPADIQMELQRVAGDIKHKGQGLATVIQSLERLSEYQKAEGQRLAAKAKATEAHADRLKAYAVECMQAIGLQRIETGTYTLAIRLNNPKVDVLDEAAIPADYWRQPTPPPEVDKAAILNRWRATGGKSTPSGVAGGECVPGTNVIRNSRLDIS